MARLLETKLQPPPLREERVYRPNLYEHLDGFNSGVVLVSAPPGFGKSTLVVEWLTAQGRPFAWYSLDRYDSDVGLFGDYLGLAVGTLGGDESGALSMPGALTDPRAIVATVVDDLTALPERAAVVLDDYHELTGEEVHEAVSYLVDNLPDGLLLVIITRSDPPLPLSRLRSTNRLQEIRGAELRFEADQVAEYFRSNSHLELDPGEVSAVVEKSEGWVSALQLVALGIDHDDTSRVAGALTASHPYIAGYLVDEVLSHLRPELSRFLMDTSAFLRFDARLCRDAAGIANAQALIEEVERKNAFLTPLDDQGEWYRYHQLFADLLRSKLRASDPDRHLELLNRAARSSEKRRLTDDAVAYALEADDVELAAAIVDRGLGPSLGAGEIARLRSWLRLFPVPAGAASHVVALGWAWCRIFEGDMDAALALVDRIESEHLQDFTRDPRGQLELMRAMAAFQAGDISTAESSARKGLEMLLQPSPYMEALGHLYVGRALHAQAKRDEARPYLEKAASLSERGNTLAAVSALFWLGVIDMDMGNLEDAERSMRRAQEVGAASTGPTGEPHPASGIGDIGLAYIRLNQLEIDEAMRLAERGNRLLKRSAFVEMVFRALFVWAEALSMSGRFVEAQAVVDEGIDWLQGRKIAGGPLEGWLLMSQARNSWRQGRIEESRERIDRVMERGLGSPQTDEALGFYEAADAVALALRRGVAQESGKMLAGLPPDPTGNVMFSIKRLVLEATQHELEGSPRTAVETLEEALELAREGYRFQFTFGGPSLRPVLQRMIGRSRNDEFLRSIVDRLPFEPDRTTSQPIDPLTDREIEVLAEIAAGYTNEEIADRLFISRGTVKRHASNIYLKLGAHHRAEAAARGRELGLID